MFVERLASTRLSFGKYASQSKAVLRITDRESGYEVQYHAVTKC